MTLQEDVTKLQSQMRAAVREHWKTFLIEGIVLSILGLAAIIVPQLASLAVTIYLAYRFAENIARALGATGLEVLVRLSAFILMCIGIEIVWNGYSALISTHP